MPAINVELTPQGPRVTVLEQQLIFFIGPSQSNRLDDMNDYQRRFDEVEILASHGRDDGQLSRLFARAYGVDAVDLKLSVVQGGKRGVACPNLVVDLVESKTADGHMLCSVSTPENGSACCRALMELLDADWVDVWWMGTQGNAQIDCDRGGKAVLSNNRGQREII